MSNIVLDTNCLIMAISAKNEYNLIWQAFLRGDYMLCVTNEIIEEYLEVIARNVNPWVAESVIYAILTRQNVKKIVTHYRFQLIQADLDDNKFVDCAIAANAKFIVTEDHHFDVLKDCSFPKVEVIGIELFMNFLKSKSYILSDNNLSTFLSEPAVPYGEE